jgi:hypothetical protein
VVVVEGLELTSTRRRGVLLGVSTLLHGSTSFTPWLIRNLTNPPAGPGVSFAGTPVESPPSGGGVDYLRDRRQRHRYFGTPYGT